MSSNVNSLADYIVLLQKSLAAGYASEGSHYPTLKAFLELLGDSIVVTSLPHRIECGAPDFIITKGSATIGYVEAKDIGKSLDEAEKSEQLHHYLKPNLLILDDFAMKEFTKTQAEDLYELIDWRHSSSSMIVTANRAPKDWYPLFPNLVIAESALDRLISCAHVITLAGRSYRSLLRPDKDLEREVATV